MFFEALTTTSSLCFAAISMFTCTVILTPLWLVRMLYCHRHVFVTTSFATYIALCCENNSKIGCRLCAAREDVLIVWLILLIIRTFVLSISLGEHEVGVICRVDFENKYFQSCSTWLQLLTTLNGKWEHPAIGVQKCEQNFAKHNISLLAPLPCWKCLHKNSFHRKESFLHGLLKALLLLNILTLDHCLENSTTGKGPEKCGNF